MSISPADPSHDPGGKIRIPIPPGWIIDVLFDGPGCCYRYKLSHRWSPGPLALWALMNPSTADRHWLDPTVHKTARMSQRMGFGGQFIANAAAYRATKRMQLLDIRDPVGPGNHAAILEMAEQADLIVIAHGRLPGSLQPLAGSMCRLLQDAGHSLNVLRLTHDGVPMHPLARGKGHIPDSTTPKPWFYKEAGASPPL